MQNNRFFTREQHIRSRFYQMPKALFKEKQYKKMSSNTKIVYMLLADRNELSIQNDWYDKDGRIYLIFTQEQLSEESGLSVSTIKRCMKELVKFNLLFKKRQGLNKADLLYLLKLEISSEQLKDKLNVDISRTVQNELSGSIKKELQEGSSMPANKTNTNKTDIIDTYNISSSNTSTIDKKVETTIINNNKEEGIKEIINFSKSLKVPATFKLIRGLLKLHSKNNILKAIELTAYKQYKNLRAYIIAVLKDLEATKENIINKIQSKNFKESKESKLRFDNFKGRDYSDIDNLENKLLGWA